MSNTVWQNLSWPQGKPKNAAAVALGKLAKGKPKRYSVQQRAALAARLALVRKLRWPVKPVDPLAPFVATVERLAAKKSLP